MNALLMPLGWVYVVVSLFFLLGLLKPLAHFFYPKPPTYRVRAAAPVLFATLAGACFAGVGFQALLVVLAVGACQIVSNHLHLRKQKMGRG